MRFIQHYLPSSSKSRSCPLECSKVGIQQLIYLHLLSYSNDCKISLNCLRFLLSHANLFQSLDLYFPKAVPLNLQPQPMETMKNKNKLKPQTKSKIIEPFFTKNCLGRDDNINFHLNAIKMLKEQKKKNLRKQTTIKTNKVKLKE